MEKVLQIRQQLLRSRSLPALVIGLSLTVLALAIWSSFFQLRDRIREQRIQHDGETLQAVALMQQYSDEAREESAGSLEDPGEQFNLMMRISRLKGVLGIRLFAPDGKFFNAFPAYITETELPSQDLALLSTFKPVSRFFPRGRLDQVDMLSEARGVAVPLLVVEVPLQRQEERRLVGVAQFIIQGESIAREFAELDRSLLSQASLAFVMAGSILTVALALAFRRIQRANRQLAERTESLLRANQELALAAKSSAVGAVTAHLIHGLRNPLSGLQSFVSSQLDNRPAGDSDWQEAVATTKRMQSLIGQVVRVLEEQQVVADYEISVQEVVDIISSRVRTLAGAVGVRFAAEAAPAGTLSNCEANLIILILENLIQNAIQATPEGKAVRMYFGEANGRIFADVLDEGPGFPLSLQPHLFAPCRSTKQGGGGIGLAISKQLASHLGAALELKSSTTAGCVFRLTLPAKRTAGQAAAAVEPVGA